MNINKSMVRVLCLISLLCIGAAITATVAAAQSTGPAIYNITVSDYTGDNDSHVERGESAIVNFNVSSGANISSVAVFLNDSLISRVDNVGMTAYQGNATTGNLSDGEYIFRITASSTDGSSNSSSYHFNVTRDYIGWIRIDHLWGATRMFHTPVLTGNYTTDYFVGAVSHLKGSIPDGNTITLSGGKEIEMPDINMTVDGGMLINRTMECLIYLGKQNGSVPLNYTFNAGNYPVYYIDAKTNNVTGTLDASKNYDNMTLGVGLINITMTPRDPVVYRDYIFHDYGNITTDANGDARLPVMEIANPDFYMLVVFDRSIPNGIGLVAVAPFYVVNYTADLGMRYTDSSMAPKQELNPGDNLMVNVSMPNATDREYLFAAFAIPQRDYYGNIDVNSTGMISDMNLTIDAFTVNITTNYNDTIRNASSNVTWAKQFVDENFYGTNVSAAVGTSVGKSLELPVAINDDATPGKYILVAAAINTSDYKVISLEQSSFDVTAPSGGVCFPWYLLLVLIILLLIIIILYWYYYRKKKKL